MFRLKTLKSFKYGKRDEQPFEFSRIMSIRELGISKMDIYIITYSVMLIQ